MRKYKITRLYILTGKCRPKNKVKDIRCRYLAKSLLVRANSDNKKIEFTNFRGSHFKDVTFKSANFYGNDFWGATFNKCKFNNSKISSTIFVSCSFKKCDFSQTLFNNCIFINTNISECKNIDVSSGVNILKEYPHVDCSVFVNEKPQQMGLKKYSR